MPNKVRSAPKKRLNGVFSIENLNVEGISPVMKVCKSMKWNAYQQCCTHC